MNSAKTVATRLFVSACAVTRTTDLVARWTGAGFFLPALFVLRYANMGGLDPAVFADELAGARSFRERRWCEHWDRIAAKHLRGAERALAVLAGPAASGTLFEAARLGRQAPITRRADLLDPLSQAAPVLADHGPQPSSAAIERIVHERFAPGQAEQLVPAVTALDAWIKAITYYQVSAFPGHTPARTAAYWRSGRLFEALVAVLAPGLGVTIEHVEFPVDGDAVRGYLVLPQTPGPHPTVLVTNGLEGTLQELLIPLVKYRHSGLGIFVMEMPGSYAYQQPMSDRSEGIYRQVIDQLTSHPRVDPARLGMVGVSFGGYWSARIAATDPRLRCAVACGAPTHRTFGPTGSIGIPEIIIRALRATTQATTLVGLAHTLRALSLRKAYREITIPLLVINGDHDTLLSTQDSIDLADNATGATLILYPDDDHCAMGHYHEWLELSQRWLHDHLMLASSPAGSPPIVD